MIKQTAGQILLARAQETSLRLDGYEHTSYPPKFRSLYPPGLMLSNTPEITPTVAAYSLAIRIPMFCPVCRSDAFA